MEKQMENDMDNILGFYRELTPVMENRVEKMEHEMETAIYGVT